MKVLILSDCWVPFPGGAETYMRNVALQLTKRGHQVYVLTSYEPARQETEFQCVYQSVPVYGQHKAGWEVIWNHTQKFNPNIVVIHHFFAGEFPEVFTQLGIPTVEIIHSRPRTPQATLAVFNSNYTANTPGQLRKPLDMVILPMPAPECVAPEHGNHIGHIKPIGGKGIMMTYALAKRFPNRQFMVLRGEWQGAETMISGCPNLTYMEPVKDIREFYKHCRLLLMPSEREEAGTIPFEATLNGLPCMSSDAMGLPETNRGGVILPISTHVWEPAMPNHPDNESITRWSIEVEKLDSAAYYAEVVNRQKAFMDSVPWPGLYDELASKMEMVIRDYRRN